MNDEEDIIEIAVIAVLCVVAICSFLVYVV